MLMKAMWKSGIPETDSSAEGEIAHGRYAGGKEGLMLAVLMSPEENIRM